MSSPLEYSCSPVLASKAYSTACPFVTDRCALLKRPLASTWVTFSPVDSAKTSPFATTGGSGTDRFPDIQAGVSTGFPPSLVTLNAMMLPWAASPWVTGNLAVAAGGPQIGAYTHVVPSPSLALANAPQMP